MGISGLCMVLDRDDTEVRASLRRLAAKGMVCLSGHGEPTVLDPDESVGRLLEQRLKRLHAEQQELLSFGYSLIRRSLAWRSPGRIPRDSGPAVGVEAVQDPAKSITVQARREVLTMQPDWAVTPQKVAATRRVCAPCLQRGVTVKALVHRRALEDEATSAHLTELIRLGAQIRLLDGECQRVLIADGETAVVQTERDSSPTTILVEQRILVGTLRSLFDHCWSHAADASPLLLPECESASLDATQLKVLHAMARAEKDEIGARELGMSVRAYRGRVAELLKHFKATTRFQAALRAKEKGLV
ncbi:hypothetical protein GCM10010421_41020 [Streptomyces glaucus]|uniref:HTH luxR-type domain-containing protein n=2 Tax=Streptomyces glaucus TaxID=284029 RepID=A0ABN3K003_9ACTN